MSIEHVAAMRRNYLRDGLLEHSAPMDPFVLFEQWFNQAVATEQAPIEPNAMMLASVDASGQPHCRVLLLKGVTAEGFIFFTNYDSAKGQQLSAQPKAAMTFFWPTLERQVRIEGEVKQVAPAVSDAYYAQRPLGSRLGAWASEQSQPIASREVLEQAMQQVEQRFADSEPTRPAHWGGFCLEPQRIEFWQGRTCRLHDRLNFVREPEGGWRRERLAP